MQAEGLNGPITALQLVNTATPIGFGLAYFIAKMFRKNIYTKVEVETLKSAVPMGVINIVEGVIPLVMNDIVRGVVATAIRWICWWCNNDDLRCGCNSSFRWCLDDPNNVLDHGQV